ncbi:signal peptidase II [Pseudohoeflea coraliihabitans]|uniref:Lipoprotein signal peptidase n=1 Tax=Pseudohoeflea coraliihabitans TaxID=2860393 RepID=A0ABS6WTH5_9HYPH|nr:signal peptidase II [Pseudohoeflea sp. DP4N28-3]MBW3099262.1 signal peptidase II [Pseudohoeflea sp. DP4N28-3]
MKGGLCVVVVLAGAALDLVAKAWARASLEPYGSALDFLPFISLRLTFNEGVSFSLLSFDHDGGRLALLAFTGLLTLSLSIWAYRMPHGGERLALSVIIAGALANFLDRGVNGAVTDYLDLHFGDWHPFVFNLADVWISIGAMMLVALQVFAKEELRSAAR